MLVAYLGSQLGFLLGGAFITETIFDWRGLGSLWVGAVLRRDYPVVEAATFVAAGTTLFGILLGDWLGKRIDRREEKLS
jgi:peptide/nickel transport system permease protein